jgi:hypothetical protein
MSGPDFPLSRYNRYGVLRVNLMTVLAILFLSRHVLTFVILGIALSRAHPSSRDAFNGLFEPIFMLADIPALFVLLAAVSRHPKSGKALRIIWDFGSWLLLGSAAIYVGLLARKMGDDPARYGWMAWTMVAGTAVSAAYVTVARYPRALFHQYPDASLAEDDTGKS